MQNYSAKHLNAVYPLLVVLVMLASVCNIAAAQSNNSTWSNVVSGEQDITGGVVSDLLFDSEGNLYVAGTFNKAGNLEANKIAVWNGSEWSQLGLGIDGANEFYSPRVNAIVESQNGSIYVAGFFMSAGGSEKIALARWDGIGWSNVGAGINVWSRLPEVHAAVSDGNGGLYVGGFIERADNIEVNNIAHWDGYEWSALGSGVQSSVPGDHELAEIDALTMDRDGYLYAGGLFTQAGGMTVNHVAKWDGVAWSPLGSGLTQPGVPNITVTAMTHDGEYLYVAGGFTLAGGQPAHNIARWNGETWESLGDGLCGYAYSLEVINEELYAAGDFKCSGFDELNNIAKWNGSAWTNLDTGTSNPVLVIKKIEDRLYVAGGGFRAGDNELTHLAAWGPVEDTNTENNGDPMGNSNPESINVFPNPFSDELNIDLALNEASSTKISIVSADGKEIEIISNKYLLPGSHYYHWAPPPSSASGVYMVKLSTDRARITQPVVYVGNK